MKACGKMKNLTTHLLHGLHFVLEKTHVASTCRSASLCET
ncbi:unnamed protein product [Amoebophrya sp. A25]|nr:unnamed protein product [Amoebophrya sp. A25]|eukprot:GSA25T00004073001.1